MEPPREIPAELEPAFTLQGRVPVEHWYFADGTAPGCARVYTRAEIDTLIQKALRREENYYGATDTYLYTALDAFPIKGKVELGRNRELTDDRELRPNTTLSVSLVRNPSNRPRRILPVTK